MEKKLICFDLDGTLNMGDELLPGVKELFQYLVKNKIRYVYLTNNSSRSKNTYVKRIQGLGLPCTYEDVVTSTDLAIDYVVKKKFKNVYTLGTKDFKNEVSPYFHLINDEEGKKCDCVLVAFDTELTYLELNRACQYLFDGAAFIGVNKDWRCPIENNRYIVDCGSICQAIKNTTDRRPYFLGKPSKMMLEVVSKKYGVAKDNMMMVGDRVYTDIMCAVNAKVDSVFVLSGEGTIEDVKKSKGKPTYILEGSKDLPKLLDILNDDSILDEEAIKQFGNKY